MQTGFDVWMTDAWQQDALAWIDRKLDARGLRRNGDIDKQRIRPWSTVFRFSTDHGRFWFKANSAMSFHETNLYPLLGRVAPDTVLQPLATHAENGWIVVPDGGTTLIHSASGNDLFKSLLELIPRYALLQIRLMPHRSLLRELGVPDMRPHFMPERFDEALTGARSLAIAEPTSSDIAILDDVRLLRPAYQELCHMLARSKVSASLDHGDLHANNILADVSGSSRIYDWGDSSLAHPFATMLLFLRNAATAMETGYNDPRLIQLRDAYLDQFRAWGSRGSLLDTMETACRVAMVSRVITWIRALELGPMPDPSWHKAPFEWLSSLQSASYLGDHTIT